MWINTRVELQWNEATQSFEELRTEGYEYEGLLTLAGGGGGDDTQTTQQTNEAFETAKPYIQNILRAAAEQSGSSIQTPEAAQQLTQQEIDLRQQLAATQSQQAQQYQTAAAQNLVVDPSRNPAFQNYLQVANKELSDQYLRQVLPQIQGGAVAAGGVGGSRQGVAEGIAAEGLAKALASQTTGLTSQAYGQNLQAALQTLQLAPQTQALGTQGIPLLAGARGLETERANQPLLAQREALNNYISQIAPFAGTSNTTITQPGGTRGIAPGQAALAGAATGFATTGSPWGAAAGAVGGYYSAR